MTEPITNCALADGSRRRATSAPERLANCHSGDRAGISGPMRDGAIEVNWQHLRSRLAAVRGVWGLAVLANLARGITRPGELIEAIRTQAPHDGEISWTMLTRTLRRLQKDGYVGREEVSRLPRVTRYWLTPAGWWLVGWLTRLDAFCQETEPGPPRGQGVPARDNHQTGMRRGAA